MRLKTLHGTDLMHGRIKPPMGPSPRRDKVGKITFGGLSAAPEGPTRRELVKLITCMIRDLVTVSPDIVTRRRGPGLKPIRCFKLINVILIAIKLWMPSHGQLFNCATRYMIHEFRGPEDPAIVNWKQVTEEQHSRETGWLLSVYSTSEGPVR